MELEKGSISILTEALEQMEKGFANLPDVSVSYDSEKLRGVLLDVATRMQDNYPYFHPQYAGQMLKPPHPVARAAYMLAMWVNPNNHALDGGRASSQMEKEAVAELARVFGWTNHLGHLTSGGTMANLEALWVSGKVSPGKKVVASDQAHTTHTAGSLKCSSWTSRRYRLTRVREWTSERSKSASRKAMSARLSRPWALRAQALSTRFPKSSGFERSTDSDCTPTLRTVGTTSSWTTSEKRRPERSAGSARSTQ